MATLSYPSSLYVPQGGRFSLISNTRSFSSPLSGTTQTVESPGARWAGQITYHSLNETQTRELLAFLMKLRGMSGRFFYGDPFHQTPQGVATGTPAVSGASQTGSSLITNNWTPDTTDILKAGDFFQLDTNELKVVTDDANSDSSGFATLSIEPPLRSSPTHASAIILIQPKTIMRLQNDQQTSWDYARLAIASTTINMIESFT